MTVLELRFPTGRFHATPWGRHVNEGALEWPPSPWRILRALLATWYLKAQSQYQPEVVRGLLESLAGVVPVFSIPTHVTLGHTRHFMPGNEPKHKENKQDVFGPAKTKDLRHFHPAWPE